MESETHIICAYDVAADGTCSPVGALENATVPPQSGYRWLHVDLKHPETEPWLHAHFSVAIVEALTQSETRPRCIAMEDGLFLNLRGVNLNPGANADDMVSVRLWTSGNLIISARMRKVWAIDTLRARMDAGQGPENLSMFLAELAYGLTKRIETVSLELVEGTDALEEDTLAAGKTVDTTLATLRQSVIKLRRFVRPQNEALAELSAGEVYPLEAECSGFLQETSNRTKRIVEEMDATSDRLQALQDHADLLHASALGRNSYVLSIVAAIFLPLGFLTGLFGINVGGMPGVEAAYGFWLVTASSILLGVVLFLVFRFLKWL